MISVERSRSKYLIISLVSFHCQFLKKGLGWNDLVNKNELFSRILLELNFLLQVPSTSSNCYSTTSCCVWSSQYGPSSRRGSCSQTCPPTPRPTVLSRRMQVSENPMLKMVLQLNLNKLSGTGHSRCVTPNWCFLQNLTRRTVCPTSPLWWGARRAMDWRAQREGTSYRASLPNTTTRCRPTQAWVNRAAKYSHPSQCLFRAPEATLANCT